MSENQEQYRAEKCGFAKEAHDKVLIFMSLILSYK